MYFVDNNTTFQDRLARKFSTYIPDYLDYNFVYVLELKHIFFPQTFTGNMT